MDDGSCADGLSREVDTLRGFPLSNRGESAEDFGKAPPVGVDTVGISIPIVDADEVGATVSVVHSGTAEEKRTYRRRLPGGGFIAWGLGHTVWAEASLPKRAGEDNIEAVCVDEAWELLADLHDEVSRYVEFDRGKLGHLFEQASLKRLDAVRDFDDVRSVPTMLDGLANVAVKGRAKQRRFADGERNRAQTLSVGPKTAWLSTLYDKHEETLGQAVEAPEGRVRFEARMRSDVLTGQWARQQGGAVRQLMDLDEARVGAMCRAMFERVGFDREVQPMSNRLAELLNDADLSPREQAMLWTYLTGVPHGLDLGLSRPTERKYRTLAEDLGVVMLAREYEGPRQTIALDYDRGREVCRVA